MGLNQSESDLSKIPMSRRYCQHRNNNDYSGGRRGHNSECALRRSGPDGFESSLSRSANASWSKADVRAKRHEESNLFFNIMMEPDGDAAAGAASPLTNSLSSLQSSSSSAFREIMNSS